MKFRAKHFLCFIMLMLVIAGSYSCQKSQDGEKAVSSNKGESGESGTDAPVAELLKSMNMYHFAEPVQAPDFELVSVTGARTSLSQHRGKVVMLSFWATW